MNTSYTLWTNLDSRFRGQYEAGSHRLVRGYMSTTPLEQDSDDRDDLLLCEEIWQLHNRDNRPDGQMAPSLSVGDVIELPGGSYSVCGEGFAQVEMLATDQITDRNWRECL